MDLIDRQAAIEHCKKRLYETALNNMNDDSDLYQEIADNRIETWLDELPSAQPEITLLQATKTALEFMELCGGTTAFLITPDGEKLSCDWGYVEEGLRELVRYAERRTDG